MAKVTVTIELDEQSYRAKYGPDSEWWKEYHYDSSDYKPMEGMVLARTIIEILTEGFYDWDSKGWLKMTIDGKVVRGCCSTLEGESHRWYCAKLAGPEASDG
jgi:hypothetical protein